MKRSMGLWQLMGFAVTSLGGTLLHFLYDWTDSVWVAPFSGVNESTWEHMKLLFWPMFIFALIQSFFFRDRKDFWCVKLKGTLLGLVLIPVIFYTYNGVIGKSPDWINIAIFFISAAVGYRRLRFLNQAEFSFGFVCVRQHDFHPFSLLTAVKNLTSKNCFFTTHCNLATFPFLRAKSLVK